MKAAHAEGRGNRSDARARWQSAHTGARERDLPARDAAAFRHQELSTPCLTTIARAETTMVPVPTLSPPSIIGCADLGRALDIVAATLPGDEVPAR